jgi:protein-S-isoprenylcysteine O-methyltransferase Ste14
MSSNLELRLKPGSTARGDLAVAVGSSSAVLLCRLRTARGYEAVFRAVGVAWFLSLACIGAIKVFVVAKAIGSSSSSPAVWPALMSSLCLLLFYGTLCWLILSRPTPVARSAGFSPAFIGFAGTYLPWTVVLFAPSVTSAKLELASAVLLLIGALTMVVVILHLGRCFSIVPQARTLVRTGPYAIVRHPLYLAEEIALVGTLLQFHSPATVVLFLVHGALQVRRIFYEEDLLSRSFPEYHAYATSTARLIPYLW